MKRRKWLKCQLRNKMFEEKQKEREKLQSVLQRDSITKVLNNKNLQVKKNNQFLTSCTQLKQVTSKMKFAKAPRSRCCKHMLKPFHLNLFQFSDLIFLSYNFLDKHINESAS